MYTTIAKEHYRGIARKKLNCAQSVAQAFAEKFPTEKTSVAQCAAYSVGRAPHGYCGALYVAREIIGKYFPDALQAFESVCVVLAGALTCKEIRALKKLSCEGCVVLAAAFIEGKTNA